MKKEKDITFGEYIKISKWVLSIGFKISPSSEIIRLVGQIFNNLGFLFNTYIISKIIDALVKESTSTDATIQKLLPYLGILLVVNTIFVIIAELRGYADRKMNQLSSPFYEKMKYDKVRELGLQTLEFPDIANLKQKVEEWLGLIGNIDSSIVNIISFLIRIIVSGVVLYSTVPILIPIVLLASILFYFNKRKYFKMEFDWIRREDHISGRRKHYKISSDLSNVNTIGEISITGAHDYLDAKFQKFFDYYAWGFLRIIKKEYIADFLLTLLSNFVTILGYIQVFVIYLAKSITIGNVTFYLGTIDGFYSGIERFFREFVIYRDNMLKVKDVYAFFQLEPKVKDGEYVLPRLINPPSIDVKNISFHYPNNKIKILKDFSLTIKAGEKIAIVGENGAGKSTLVKLLARVYDPQSGEVLINERNIKEIKLDDWYKNLGVLFQDFNFYGELDAQENIYIGKSVKPMDRDRVKEASVNADAYDFIQKYPKKFETVMSERFEGGIQPSKGQQQKIAIARFFYRDAPVAIFDEPTSAIDAESEYKIFNKIYKFFDNKTVIIISHRFSTVRNADRIVVLDQGRIVEEGSHAELLAMDGKYAQAFKKQAEGYL
jgi:ATP-binding cassette subfamily B protein